MSANAVEALVNELQSERTRADRLETQLRAHRGVVDAQQEKLTRTESVLQQQRVVIEQQAGLVDALRKQLDAAREQAADNRQKAILVGWQNGTAAARMRQGA